MGKNGHKDNIVKTLKNAKDVHWLLALANTLEMLKKKKTKKDSVTLRPKTEGRKMWMNEKAAPTWRKTCRLLQDDCSLVKHGTLCRNIDFM